MQTFMAPHSSTLAWKIPWTEEPGGPQSLGSLRVGQDSVTSLSLFTFMYWRRKWQPTPVFLPGESQGWGSLMGCSRWGCTESDRTEATQQQQQRRGNEDSLKEFKHESDIVRYVFKIDSSGSSLRKDFNGKDLLEGELRHTYNFQVFIWEYIGLNLVAPKPQWLGDLFHRNQGEGFFRQDVEAKQRQYLIGHSSSS